MIRWPKNLDPAYEESQSSTVRIAVALRDSLLPRFVGTQSPAAAAQLGGSCDPQRMPLIRLFLGMISLGAALFCGWEAYLSYHVNSRPHWLAGPLQVLGHTVSPNACVAVLGALALSFVALAAYAFFGSRSGN